LARRKANWKGTFNNDIYSLFFDYKVFLNSKLIIFAIKNYIGRQRPTFKSLSTVFYLGRCHAFGVSVEYLIIEYEWEPRIHIIGELLKAHLLPMLDRSDLAADGHIEEVGCRGGQGPRRRCIDLDCVDTL
jgi:hypothetical protein